MTIEMKSEDDVYGYSKMGVDELRRVISDLVRSNEEVIAEKKDMAKAANETIKETKARIKIAVERLTLAERAGTNVAHEQSVASILRSVS